MLFEEFVEQHRVDLVVADGVGFSVFVHPYQGGIHLCYFFASTPGSVLGRWPSPAVPGRIPIPQLALQRCCSTPLATTTRPLEQTRSSLMTQATITVLSARLRSSTTSMQTLTLPLVISRF